jgi:spermidine/putrescine transport system permease protein
LAVGLLVAPAVLLVGGGLLIPAANLLLKSFLVPGALYGQVTHHLTFANYAAALSNPVYRSVALKSFGFGALAAFSCLVLGYPVAYFINFRLRRGQNLALFLVVVSLFSSYLVRLYAWYTILGEHGVVNDGLIRLGVIHQPLLFLLFSPWAVWIAFVNIFLPYTILILTSSLRSVRSDILETAQVLGAGPIRTFRRVVLPLTIAGAVGAFAYTFILTSGDYITPALLGGTSGIFIGNIISDQFGVLGNQPLGAAMSFVMLAVFVIVYVGLSRLERLKRF